MFCPKYSVVRLRSAASLLEVTVTVYTCTLRKRKSLKPLKKASFFFYASCQARCTDFNGYLTKFLMDLFFKHSAKETKFVQRFSPVLCTPLVSL